MRMSARHNRGFTLVEMLVSMAILTTVISGVVILYIGAVNTTRNTFKAIDNFEIGRSLLAAMERDLERSFAARDYGKYFQFHGAPQGFMYVGVLTDGNLGRVTYAINRLDDANDFTMTDTIGLRLVIERAMAQFSGELNTFPFVALEFTKRFCEVLALDGAITAGNLSQDDIIRLLPTALLNGIDIDVNNFPGSTELPWRLKPLAVEEPPGSGFFVSFDDAVVELDINVKTAYLMRFEEPGVTDISSFQLPPNPDSPSGELLRFPGIDPSSVASDRNFPSTDFLANQCGSLAGGTDAIAAVGQAALDCYTWSTIVTPAPGDPRDLDLRTMSTGQSGFAPPASYITPRTISRIFEASKREVWLDLITGTGVAPLVFTQINGNRWADGYLDAIGENPYDYAIGDRIVTAGIPVTYQDLSGPTAAEALFRQQFYNFDILGVQDFFNYADEDGKYEATYNTLDDIPGYTFFADPLTAFPTIEDRFVSFDEAMGDEMTGILTNASQGSPIAPRIPALVSPRFWIMSEGATPSNPPFKRFFEQVIEVPTATSRTLPSQFVANSG